MKLGSKELSVLIVLFGLIVILLTYQFYFRGYLEKLEVVEKKQEKLDKEVTKLENLDNKKQEIDNETKKVKREISTLLENFPAYTKYEDGIMYMQELNDDLDMDTREYKVTESGVALSLEGYSISMGRLEFSYYAEYAKVKEFIKGVYAENSDKKTIESMSMATSEGDKLTGSIVLNLYTLTDGTREYEAPDVPSVDLKPSGGLFGVD